METVFIAFANSSSTPLPSLSQEDEQVNAILTRRKQRGGIDLVREQYASTQRLTDGLFQYRRTLSLKPPGILVILRGGQVNLVGTRENLKLGNSSTTLRTYRS